MLLQFTLAVNIVALAASLWLGLYVVTRSPRSAIAWLTGLTLWSVSGLYLNILLALSPPPEPANVPAWALTLLPFWPSGVFERGWGGWLQGWLVTPAVVIWHHVTMLMRPGRMNRWRWTRVLLGYGLAAAAVVVQVYTPYMFAAGTGDPLYLTTLTPGPLLPYFQLALIAYIVMSLINLARSARAAPAAMPRKQLMLLAAATLIAGLTAPVAMGASLLGAAVPRVLLSLLLGAAVILLGYGVARYSALVEGRVIQRDLLYNAAAIGLVTLIYLVVTWLSVRLYQAPAAAFTFVLMLAIVTHSLVDVARSALDAFFYRSNARLRASLRRAGEAASGDRFAEAVHALGESVSATYCLLWLFEGADPRLAAAYRWHGRDVPELRQEDLTADDALPVPPGRFAAPGLAEAALLVPLYTEERQLGALLLGRPANGMGYAAADRERLLEAGDRLAVLIYQARREAEHLAEITRLIEARPAGAGTPVVEVPVQQVEDALRNLGSLPYLGDHPLGRLGVVTGRLPSPAATHLDRGRAVYQVLAESVEKLRPPGSRPRDPIPREWHAYVILHDAYLEDVPNRNIMARLYISEGTFNRTRRAGLRAVARLLAEQEAALA